MTFHSKCPTRKVCYDDRGQAERMLRLMESTTDPHDYARMRVYECGDCGRWHHGRAANPDAEAFHGTRHTRRLAKVMPTHLWGQPIR